MPNELENKELIEKLPKEGVHCYPANPSKITRNRVLSVVFCVIGVFLVLIGLLKVTDNILKIALLVVGGLSALISILVFAQSFLIAKFRVAVDYNEKNVVLRYRYLHPILNLLMISSSSVKSALQLQKLTAHATARIRLSSIMKRILIPMTQVQQISMLL